MSFRPLVTRGRRTIVGVLFTFVLFSAASVAVSVSVTRHSQHVGFVLQVAARQRTLADHYVNDVLLARSGAQADPAYTARLLNASARYSMGVGLRP